MTTDTQMSFIDRIALLIYYVFGAINVVLGLRFVFRLLGANPGSPIVDFIYDLSSYFLIPFRSIFPAAAEGGAVFEPTVLVAILLYSLLARGIVALLALLFAPNPTQVE